MAQLIFAEEDMLRERDVILDELERIANNPDLTVRDAVMEASFGNHPYGRPVGGLKEDVMRMELHTLRAFYTNHYRPDRAWLIVVGDVEKETLLAAVREKFGALRKEKSPLPFVAPPAEQKSGLRKSSKKRGKRRGFLWPIAGLPSNQKISMPLRF